MLLELTLYFIFGMILLLIKRASTVKDFSMDILFVAAWPFYLLLKYVEYVDKVKKQHRRER